MAGEIETKDREIEVELTDNDIAARKDVLCGVLEQRNGQENERARVGKDYSGSIKQLRKQERELLKAIRTGKETITVQVFERRNDRLHQIEIVRLDTNEVLETRPLSAEERQADLFAKENKSDSSELHS